nr:unnamed protein product [Spirometra erinaceieuropaei]
MHKGNAGCQRCTAVGRRSYGVKPTYCDCSRYLLTMGKLVIEESLQTPNGYANQRARRRRLEGVTLYFVHMLSMPNYSACGRYRPV